MATGDQTYTDFYARQIAKTRWLDAVWLGGLLTASTVLIVLLFVLHSGGWVSTYVAGLFGVTLIGVQRLKGAIRVTRSAAEHLFQFATFLREPRTREEFMAYIHGKVRPDDDSNVPEAMWSYAISQDRAEGARVVANAAFVRPTAELNFASFLRTALVLGGLFGTVLFFAWQLRGAAILSGDLTDLVPGLRGALASTLAGILGSVTLGAIGGNIDRVLEEMIWETESFVSGPVARALAALKTDTPIRDETDLWNALREEVAELRRESVMAYAKLADDTHAYTKALGDISQRLADLPAIQVPTQLAKLEDVVAAFSSGVQSLERTSKTLLDAVSTVGLVVPAQTLSELAHLKEAAAQSAQRAQTVSVELGLIKEVATHGAQSAEAGGVKLGHIREQISIGQGDLRDLTRIAVRSEDLRSAAGLLSAQIDTLATQTNTQAHAVGEQLSRIEAGLERTATVCPPGSNESEPRDLTTIVDALRGIRETLVSSGSQLQATSAGVTSLAERLPVTLDHALQQIHESKEQLGAVAIRLRRLDAVYDWHERATRAPLIRLLLLPLWRERRV